VPTALDGTSGAAAAERSLSAELEALARHECERLGIPGAAVGILEEDRSVGFGMGVASVATGEPVLASTPFLICSVTKPFTATLAMSVVERGELDLDEPVARRLPGIVLASGEARARLSLRHLLTHSSGLECELPGDLDSYGNGSDALDRALGDYSRLRQWLVPGEAWGYCNSGYWLAGAVAAQACGTTFERAMESRVLRPLELRETSFAGEAPVGLASPHRQGPGEGATAELVELSFPRVRVPSGGMVSTVGDLIRFAAFHVGDVAPGAVLSTEGRRSMRRPQLSGGERPGSKQGLGWSVLPTRRGDLVGHSGSYGGYESTLVVAPEQRAALAVLTNSDAGARLCSTLEARFVERVLGHRYELPRRVRLDHTRLRRFEGAYEHGDYESLTLTAESGGLRLTGVGDEGPESSLFMPTGDSEFFEADPALGERRLSFLDFSDGGRPRVVRVGTRLGRLTEGGR
jgi:CubicO group peptidase (beta-lactamase class C family)